MIFLLGMPIFRKSIKIRDIKLQSSDGKTFKVDSEIAKCSVAIKTMLNDLGMEDEEEKVVPLPTAILRKVIQWTIYHKDDLAPPKDDENKEKRIDDISSGMLIL